MLLRVQIGNFAFLVTQASCLPLSVQAYTTKDFLDMPVGDAELR